MFQEEVRASVEKVRASRIVGMRQQGDRTRWEQAVERKVSWGVGQWSPIASSS